jgi:hypothetical protein
MRLLSDIRILGNGYILVFWDFFGSLLKPILKEFENNLNWFLVFWSCFNFFWENIL